MSTTNFIAMEDHDMLLGTRSGQRGGEEGDDNSTAHGYPPLWKRFREFALLVSVLITSMFAIIVRQKSTIEELRERFEGRDSELEARCFTMADQLQNRPDTNATARG